MAENTYIAQFFFSELYFFLNITLDISFSLQALTSFSTRQKNITLKIQTSEKLDLIKNAEKENNKLNFFL